jgi:hypothetical protein
LRTPPEAPTAAQRATPDLHLIYTRFTPDLHPNYPPNARHAQAHNPAFSIFIEDNTDPQTSSRASESAIRWASGQILVKYW